MMCKVFKISKSSYYAWLRNGPSDRWKENESLLVDILDIFEDSKVSYSSPRITKELHAQGKKGSRPKGCPDYASSRNTGHTNFSCFPYYTSWLTT
ncbi:MAG: transposase [Bacteroidetes bacterium]|nr:transposase [Bacteroidota bacterium]MBT4408358.1 transposase [Bacteroidota bacterium]MBT7464087.1 transposase [Bacteroidota bacterium]